MKLTQRELKAFSLAKAFEAMSADGLSRSSLEGEILEAYAVESGEHFDPNRAYIPFQLLGRRDMTAAGVQGSNYLVSAEPIETVDILRPFSATLNLGISLAPGLVGDLPLAKTATTAAGYWLTDEATAITEGQPVVGSILLTPHMAGAFTKYSRLMRLQTVVEAFLRRDLLGTLGTLCDKAVLNGSGISGEPLGLLPTPNIGTQSGTSLAWAGILAMEAQLGDANSDPTGYLATPTVRKLLKARERAAGSGMIWNDFGLNGKPAYASTNLPAGTLVAGKWDEIVLGIWGTGFTVEIDPSTGFKSGIYGMRVTMPVDVGVRHAGAFSVASSIT